MATSSIETFYSVIADVRKVSAYVIAGGVAAPIATAVLGLAPPWPSSAAVAICTSVLELVLLLRLYDHFQSKKIADFGPLMTRATAILAVTFVLYMGLFSTLTFSPPPPNARDVIGLVVRPDVRKVLRPGYDVRDALKGAGFEPTAVWTEPSVTVARLLLLLTWLVMFGALVHYISLFVLKHRSIPSD